MLILLALVIFAVLISLDSLRRTVHLRTGLVVVLLLIVPLIQIAIVGGRTASAFVHLSGTFLLLALGVSFVFSRRFGSRKIWLIAGGCGLLVAGVVPTLLAAPALNASSVDEISLAGIGLFAMLGVVALERASRERRDIDSALARQRELCDRVINISRDGVFVLDSELRIEAWNPGMERISGFGKQTVLGTRITDVLSFLEENGQDSHFTDALNGVEVVCVDKPFAFPETGKKGTFTAYYSPLKNSSGEIEETLGVIRETAVNGRQAVRAQQLTITSRIDALPSIPVPLHAGRAE